MGKRKNPAANADKTTASVVDMLLELGEYEKNHRNTFKYNAYRKAAASITAYDKPITSGQELKQLPGVGDSIAQKIDEFLSTGKMAKLEEVHHDETNKVITELTRVSGIGPANAEKLMKQGIHSIEDLKKNQEGLTEHQKIGLKYVKDFETPIPREEIEEFEKLITSELMKVDKDFHAEVCGSYRRGKDSSMDIDVLITHPQNTSKQKKKFQNMLSEVVERLQSIGLITDVLAQGGNKFMGVARLPTAPEGSPHRRLDLRVLPNDHYYCALLYYTGNDLFNQRMRRHAADHGFTMNEYSVRSVSKSGKPGKALPVNSEKDVFDHIKMDYVPPEERDA